MEFQMDGMLNGSGDPNAAATGVPSLSPAAAPSGSPLPSEGNEPAIIPAMNRTRTATPYVLFASGASCAANGARGIISATECSTAATAAHASFAEFTVATAPSGTWQLLPDPGGCWKFDQQGDTRYFWSHNGTSACSSMAQCVCAALVCRRAKHVLLLRNHRTLLDYDHN